MNSGGPVGKSILDVVGHTPLVLLGKVSKEVPGWNLWAKLDYMNPAGSQKDRVAMKIIDQAEKSGALKPGGTIVEATSGNTGAGIAMLAAVRGYKTIFVMPDKMSAEKVNYLKAWGAKVVVTPTAVAPEDPRSYYCVSRRIAKETPGAFYANQYYNEDNPRAHFETTGPEIFEQCNHQIDAFICNMGTGGSISGIGKFLKSKLPGVKVVGVDPIGSILHQYFTSKTMGTPHTYKVEGIGEDFLPGTLDFSLIDATIQVNDKECFAVARRLAREEGIFGGGSCGAVTAGALKYLKGVPSTRRTDRPANAVMLFPDGGTRYLSKFYDDDWMRENQFLDDQETETVMELLKTPRSRRIITVQITDRIHEVIRMMKQKNISQVPVLDDGKLVGIVTETDLLRDLHDGRHGLKARLSDASLDPVTQVEPHTPLAQLFDVLLNVGAVVVKDQKKIHGILSRIDLIDYLAKKGR